MHEVCLVSEQAPVLLSRPLGALQPMPPSRRQVSHRRRVKAGATAGALKPVLRSSSSCRNGREGRRGRRAPDRPWTTHVCQLLGSAPPARRRRRTCTAATRTAPRLRPSRAGRLAPSAGVGRALDDLSAGARAQAGAARVAYIAGSFRTGSFRAGHCCWNGERG